MDYGVLVVDID